MVSVPFYSSDTNTAVISSGRKGSTARQWDSVKVLDVVEREALVVGVDEAGA